MKTSSFLNRMDQTLKEMHSIDIPEDKDNGGDSTSDGTTHIRMGTPALLISEPRKKEPQKSKIKKIPRTPKNKNQLGNEETQQEQELISDKILETGINLTKEINLQHQTTENEGKLNSEPNPHQEARVKGLKQQQSTEKKESKWAELQNENIIPEGSSSDAGGDEGGEEETSDENTENNDSNEEHKSKQRREQEQKKEQEQKHQRDLNDSLQESYRQPLQNHQVKSLKTKSPKKIHHKTTQKKGSIKTPEKTVSTESNYGAPNLKPETPRLEVNPPSPEQLFNLIDDNNDEKHLTATL